MAILTTKKCAKLNGMMKSHDTIKSTKKMVIIYASTSIWHETLFDNETLITANQIKFITHICIFL